MTTTDQSTPSRPELTEDQKLTIMRHIKRLADLFDECTDPDFNHSQDYREDGVIPLFNQTVSGLFLKFHYSGPSIIWTPWGEWHFASRPFKNEAAYKETEQFMSHLSVREYITGDFKEDSFYGPVYAILAIDGEELPEAVLQTDRWQYPGYYISRAEWWRLFTSC